MPHSLDSVGDVVRHTTSPRAASGGRMLGNVESSREWQIRAELVCTLCGRMAATVQGPWAQRFVPTQLVVKDPEHASAVRRLRCPHCGGRLLLQNQEEVQLYRGPLPSEDDEEDDTPPPRRRGRPRRSSWW